MKGEFIPNIPPFTFWLTFALAIVVFIEAFILAWLWVFMFGSSFIPDCPYPDIGLGALGFFMVQLLIVGRGGGLYGSAMLWRFTQNI